MQEKNSIIIEWMSIKGEDQLNIVNIIVLPSFKMFCPSI